MKNLKEKLTQLNSSTAEIIEQFIALGQEQYFKKGSIISSPQHSFPILYFIEEGLVRGFVEHQHREHTLWVMQQGFILPAKGYFTQRKFPEYVQFLSNTTAWSLNLGKAAILAQENHLVYQILLEILEEAFYQAREREYLLRIIDAKERYLWLKTHQPSIIHLLSIDMMASYLRMSAKHFSRIKGEDAQDH